MPLSIENASFGKPALFHVEIIDDSPRTFASENGIEYGRFFSSINFLHLSIKF